MNPNSVVENNNIKNLWNNAFTKITTECYEVEQKILTQAANGTAKIKDTNKYWQMISKVANQAFELESIQNKWGSDITPQIKAKLFTPWIGVYKGVFKLSFQNACPSEQPKLNLVDLANTALNLNPKITSTPFTSRMASQMKHGPNKLDVDAPRSYFPRKPLKTSPKKAILKPEPSNPNDAHLFKIPELPKHLKGNAQLTKHPQPKRRSAPRG